MVQVTFDTNNDTTEELEHALRLLQQAIARRGKAPALDMPKIEVVEDVPADDHASKHEPAHEETKVDTGFFKIKVVEAHDEQDDAPVQKAAPVQKVPTLKELLEESLSDEELGKLFKEQQKFEEEHPKKEAKKEKSEDAYIEIIEYADEK